MADSVTSMPSKAIGVTLVGKLADVLAVQLKFEKHDGVRNAQQL
jgi:hypothetical protein